MRRKETAGAGEAAPTFEAMMERLQSLVERLERGNLSLEESIQSFEEGVDLVKRCTDVLNQAEQRIQKLTRDAEGGPAVAPLDAGAGNDEGRSGVGNDEGRSGELPF